MGKALERLKRLGVIYILKIEAILLSSLPIHVDNADAEYNIDLGKDSIRSAILNLNRELG